MIHTIDGIISAISESVQNYYCLFISDYKLFMCTFSCELVCTFLVNLYVLFL